MKTINIFFSGLSLSLQGLLISCSFVGLLLINTSFEYAYYAHYLLIIGVLLLQIIDVSVRRIKVDKGMNYHTYYYTGLVIYGILLVTVFGPVSIMISDWNSFFKLSMICYVAIPLVGSTFYFLEALIKNLNTNEDLL
jgi:hypothetical protein